MLDGAREPCVVLGLGSKLGELVREDEARARDVTLVRRFTGVEPWCAMRTRCSWG